MGFNLNKQYQYIFLFIIFFSSVFNGSNSDLLIQINFVLFSGLFLFLIKDVNKRQFLIFFIKKNKHAVLLYLAFLLYLIFQFLPLPIELIKIITPNHYKIINKLEFSSNINFASISLNPSKTFFGFLNFLNIFIIILITRATFYKKNYIPRFLFYTSLIGFIHAVIGIYLYLIGNPDFFIKEINAYKNSATGLFINRTNYAIFLVLTAIASIQYIFEKNKKNVNDKKNKDINLSIYVRCFLIFITIAIIVSLSRLGNFAYLLSIFFYILFSFFYSKENFNKILFFFFILFLFDILILGLYFGSDRLFQRFLFLSPELNYSTNTEHGNVLLSTVSRPDLFNFSLEQIKNYFYTGYGSGSYETLYKIKAVSINSSYANHAHNEYLEYFGELGLIGICLLLILIFLFLKKLFYSAIITNRLDLNMFPLVIILLVFSMTSFFDFSLHIPSIMYLVVSFFCICSPQKI
jgi:O-antigen ligase